MLTEAILRQMWPNGNSKVDGLIEAIAASAQSVFQTYGIDSDLAIAHAMAQFTVECGGGFEMTENLNYSADALVKQWPDHFTPEQAQAMAHDQQAIANQAYNGRMENQPDSDDGWNFRGRGLAQTTGREGYRKLAPLVELELLDSPELVNLAQNALKCGVADFVKLCGCMPFAEADDVIEVSQRLNGGFIGFPERTTWLVKWKKALGVSPERSGTMLWVQNSLNTLGASPQLVADSEYGPGSKAALKAFQAAHGLKDNGWPNRDTIAKIKAALPVG